MGGGGTYHLAAKYPDVWAALGVAATASGFMRLTPELRPSAGNNIFVFALP